MKKVMRRLFISAATVAITMTPLYSFSHEQIAFAQKDEGNEQSSIDNGFARTSKLIDIFDIKTNSKITYVTGGTDLKISKIVGDKVYVTFNGVTGYVNKADVTIFPSTSTGATSYYTVKSGKLIYHSYDPTSQSYYEYTVGYAPKHLNEGMRYDAFDKTAISGQDSYQYFQYMPLRIRSSYTGDEIDRFIAKQRPDSPLIGTGKYFVAAANKYNLNVAYLVAHAMLESGWGTSKIARDKKNLFGFKAVDSNPYDGAASFATWEEGIDYCAQYIDQRYLTPGPWTYHGAIIGDKAKGMNVMYSSDENWGQQIASIMYRLDTLYSSRDLRKYQLAVIPRGTPLAASIGGQGAWVTTEPTIIALKKAIVKQPGVYYEVFSDNRSYSSVYVDATRVGIITAY
ncbi:N-acetylglucosaminidase [Microbacteriaceae bacterium 4G12]